MNWPDLENVHLYVLEGASFVEAFEAARAARSEEVASEGGFFNPARRAGLKLAFFEAVEQVPAPIDWYFQAVSSGNVLIVVNHPFRSTTRTSLHAPPRNDSSDWEAGCCHAKRR